MKIGHYIPAYNQQVNVQIVCQALSDSIWAAEKGYTYRFWSSHTCDLVSMRNTALAKSLDIGLDYLFMQDADVFSTVYGGPLQRMMVTAQETGAAMVSALVAMRTNPPRANAWPVDGDRVPLGEVFEAQKVGTGMVLIDLNQVREWYDDYNGPCFAVHYGDDRAIEKVVGMDVFFSYLLQDRGQKVVCDGTFDTTHVNACHAIDYSPTQRGEAEDDTDVADTTVATGA